MQVSLSWTYIDKILSQRMAFLLIVFVLAVTAACGEASETAVSPSCARLDSVSDPTHLISRNEAEDLAIKRLTMSAPEVTGTEVERVWASCLTTLRSYEQDLLDRNSWANPGVQSPDTLIWIVEVKGISRPAGISAANANNPYRYATEIMSARNGETISGSRRYEPLLEPMQEE